jgi:hypothetical protein
VIASAAGQEGLVLGEVDADEVRRVRARLGFLSRRRPELSARLAGEE